MEMNDKFKEWNVSRQGDRVKMFNAVKELCEQYGFSGSEKEAYSPREICMDIQCGTEVLLHGMDFDGDDRQQKSGTFVLTFGLADGVDKLFKGGFYHPTSFGEHHKASLISEGGFHNLMKHLDKAFKIIKDEQWFHKPVNRTI